MRYSDVKLKDERRPTVTDLANQKQVMKKVHGWKIYHLSAQIEDMVHFFSVIIFFPITNAKLEFNFCVCWFSDLGFF